MNEELISKERALRLLASAKKNAEKAYKGDRLKGVLSGLNIAYSLVEGMEPPEEAEGNE